MIYEKHLKASIALRFQLVSLIGLHTDFDFKNSDKCIDKILSTDPDIVSPLPPGLDFSFYSDRSSAESLDSVIRKRDTKIVY